LKGIPVRDGKRDRKPMAAAVTEPETAAEWRRRVVRSTNDLLCSFIFEGDIGFVAKTGSHSGVRVSRRDAQLTVILLPTNGQEIDWRNLEVAAYEQGLGRPRHLVTVPVVVKSTRGTATFTNLDAERIKFSLAHCQR
jgi:hypothetical protein